MKKIKAQKQDHDVHQVSIPLLGFGVPRKQNRKSKSGNRNSKGESKSKG